jgi:hypothetical protein
MKWKNALIGILYLMALSVVSPRLVVSFARGEGYTLGQFLGRKKL